MKKFTFSIQERAEYWQRGTVTVNAETLDEAKKKCLAGEYDHSGDNEVMLDTEIVKEREITEVEPDEVKTN